MPSFTTDSFLAPLDDDPARNGLPPRASVLSAAARLTNSVSARCNRVLVAQHVPDSSAPDNSTTRVFSRIVYRRGHRNGRSLFVGGQILPRSVAPGAGVVPRMLMTGTAYGVDYSHVDLGAIASPDDLAYVGFVANVNTALGDPTVAAQQLFSMTTQSGIRATALAIYERPNRAAQIDTASGAATDPASFVGGAIVTDGTDEVTLIESLFREQFRVWQLNRKTHGSFYVWDTADASSIQITSASYRNVLDAGNVFGTWVSPYTDPGPAIACPAQYSGLGPNSTTRTVPVTIAFRAGLDAGTATLRAEGFLTGTSATAAVAVGAEVMYTLTGVTIRAGSANPYDKVALFGRLDSGAGPLRIWGASVYEEV